MVNWHPVDAGYLLTRGSVGRTSPPDLPMLSKNQKGLTGSIKLLQATRDGVSRSAVADYVISPACLSSGR